MQPFSILLGLGALTGLLLAGWRAPKKETIRYLDAGVWTLFGALLGSRALIVVVNFSYYQSHPGEIFQVWLGGLSSIGALVGGILAVFITCHMVENPSGCSCRYAITAGRRHYGHCLVGMLGGSLWLWRAFQCMVGSPWAG